MGKQKWEFSSSVAKACRMMDIFPFFLRSCLPSEEVLIADHSALLLWSNLLSFQLRQSTCLWGCNVNYTRETILAKTNRHQVWFFAWILLAQITPAFWFVQKQGVEGSSKVHSGSRNEQATEGTTEARSTDVWTDRVELSRAELNGMKWLWKLREQLGSHFVLGERSGCAGKGVWSVGWPLSCKQRNPKARGRRTLAANAVQLRCAGVSCPSCLPMNLIYPGLFAGWKRNSGQRATGTSALPRAGTPAPFLIASRLPFSYSGLLQYF